MERFLYSDIAAIRDSEDSVVLYVYESIIPALISAMKFHGMRYDRGYSKYSQVLKRWDTDSIRNNSSPPALMPQEHLDGVCKILNSVLGSMYVPGYTSYLLYLHSHEILMEATNPVEEPLKSGSMKLLCKGWFTTYETLQKRCTFQRYKNATRVGQDEDLKNRFCFVFNNVLYQLAINMIPYTADEMHISANCMAANRLCDFVPLSEESSESVRHYFQCCGYTESYVYCTVECVVQFEDKNVSGSGPLATEYNIYIVVNGDSVRHIGTDSHFVSVPWDIQSPTLLVMDVVTHTGVKQRMLQSAMKYLTWCNLPMCVVQETYEEE